MKLSSGTELFRKKILVAEYSVKKFCGHLLERPYKLDTDHAPVQGMCV